MRVVLNGEQGADGVDFEPHPSCMANENKPTQVSGLVASPIAFGANRLWQQTDLLIVANGRRV
jgi:hypothetical protein